MHLLKCRYHLDRMSLHTLLHVSNFLYLGRPSSRLRALAKPLLAAIHPEDGAAAVGLHIRIGDTVLPNAVIDDSRYPPECGPYALPHELHSCWILRTKWSCNFEWPMIGLANNTLVPGRVCACTTVQ